MMIKKRVVKRTSGLSLIELLVVVAILAALSLATVSLVDNIDDKERYRETLNRLTAIRGAILGPQAIDINGQLISGGFLQDIGWPPVKARDLVDNKHPYWKNFLWRYDPVWRTWFGWAGPYITALLPRKVDKLGGIVTPTLYDGWGNDFYGWEKKDVAFWTQKGPVYPHEGEYEKADLAVQSYGADGQPDGAGAFDWDMPHADQHLISYKEWAVDIEDWPIEIVNESDEDLVFDETFRFMIIIPHWIESLDPVELDFWPPDPDLDQPPDLDQYGGHIGAVQTASEINPIEIPPHGSRMFFFGGDTHGDVHRWVPYGRRTLFMVKGEKGDDGKAKRFTNFTDGFRAGCYCKDNYELGSPSTEYACAEVLVSRKQSKWEIKFYK